MNRTKIAILFSISALIACALRTCTFIPSPSGSKDPGTPIRLSDARQSVVSSKPSGTPSARPDDFASDPNAGEDGPQSRNRKNADGAEPGSNAVAAEDDPGKPESENGNDSGSGREVAEEGAEEEPGIRIVRISVTEPYAENTEIVMTSDHAPEPAFSGEFRLEGNGRGVPCCLMVRTRDAGGMEIIQYLPWDPARPNSFQTLSPMHGHASIAAYDGSRLLGRFTVIEFSGEDTISLDLNAGSDRQLASL
jgi:hypothetical protein